MRRNRLRESLDAGQPTLGTRILSSWPTVVELVGHSGMFDYVEFCGEYAPYDHATLENMGRAIELFDHLSGMIKIEQESRAHAAVRAKDFSRRRNGNRLSPGARNRSARRRRVARSSVCS